jgi:transcription elongation factor Elf1
MATALSKRCDDREAVVATLEDQLVKAKAQCRHCQQQADSARQQAMQAMDTKKTLEQMCSTIQQQQQSTVVPSYSDALLEQ